MTLEPLGSRVLIRPDPPETESKGGIILPDASKQRPLMGTIVASGPRARLAPGLHVLYPKFGGADVPFNDEVLLLIDSVDISAIVRD